MYQNIDVKISWRIRSGWKAFTMIKDVVKETMDKNLYAIVFSSTVFAHEVICKQNMDCHEQERTATGYDTEDYRKIYAENIVVWAHLKQGNLEAEQSEAYENIVLKREVLQG